MDAAEVSAGGEVERIVADPYGGVFGLPVVSRSPPAGSGRLEALLPAQDVPLDDLPEGAAELPDLNHSIATGESWELELWGVASTVWTD
ncbi:hypothetical protein E2320_012788 [Naja naja]|nr:hypothetical protein E2320_012788 [Naja naja]